jgi:hypothetical protein
MTILAKWKIWSSLLFIILATGILSACGSPSPEETSTPIPDTSSIPVERVKVVYFHRTQRCYSCVYAEGGTRYTLETYFEDELANGKVIFKVYNVEDKENAAIVKKYGAFTSSLFINTIRNGTDYIEEVTEIWPVLGNDEAFIDAVKSKVERSLRGAR